MSKQKNGVIQAPFFCVFEMLFLNMHRQFFISPKSYNEDKHRTKRINGQNNSVIS